MVPSPIAQLGGALSAWLRFALGTTDVNGFSSVPDMLNTNPAVQATDGRKPDRVLAANGLPLADFVLDNLSWPLAASNNATTRYGVFFHMIPDTVSGDEYIFTAWTGNTGGGNAARLILARSGTSLQAYVSHASDGSSVRLAQLANVFAAATPVCVGFEFNPAGANEAAQCVLSKDGVAGSASFSDSGGTPGGMPAALQNPTGNLIIGAFENADVPLLPVDAKIGPNLFVLNAAMAGVASGLLTPAARLALSNFERPT